MITDEILEHAKAEYPKECCGLVVVFKGREKYISCRNLATDQNMEFMIHPEDYVKAEDIGEIVKIVHSHPKTNANPSELDLVGIEESKLPWVIVNPLTGQVTETAPSGYKAPLIGRQYGYGIQDCYTLIKDYYDRELNIKLRDYPRSGTQEDDLQIYLKEFENEGFVKVDTLEPHDMIVLSSGHGAIYLGNNIILHHVAGRLSSRDVYGGYWMKNTRGYYRHLDLIK